MDTKKRAAAVRVAQKNYDTDELRIYDDAGTNEADGGVWVEAWVWVGDEDIAEEEK